MIKVGDIVSHTKYHENLGVCIDSRDFYFEEAEIDWGHPHTTLHPTDNLILITSIFRGEMECCIEESHKDSMIKES